MKYTIHGFSQKKAMELELDDRDLALLRWFVDFKDSGEMSKKVIDGDMFYWVQYEKLSQEYPIFKFKKDTVYRKLKMMASKGVLKHKTVKQGGVWSYYTLGERYLELISNTKVSDRGFGLKSESNGQKSGVVGLKSESNGQKSESNGLESGTKNPSTISNYHNPSTSNTTTTTTIGDSGCSNADIYEFYSQCGFGLLNHMLMEMLDADVTIYGKEWVKDALKEAVKQNKYKLSYAEGILRNWKSNGRGDDDGSSKQNNGTSSKYKDYDFRNRTAREGIEYIPGDDIETDY